MRYVSLKEAIAYGQGEIIPHTSGLLKMIGRRHEGDNARGHWSIQTLELVDPKDQKVKITVKVNDKDEIDPSLKGKVVHLYCYDGEHGLTGIKREIDDYKGVTQILKVTKTGNITLLPPGEQSQSQADAPDEHNQTADRPPARTTARTERPAEPPECPQPSDYEANAAGAPGPARQMPSPIPALKRRIAQLANAETLMLPAAHHVSQQYEAVFGEPMMPEHFAGMIGRWFIQTAREGLLNELPNDALLDATALKKPEPKN